MIINNAPSKLVIQNTRSGYKSVYVLHSIQTDYDIVGRVFWITNIDNDTSSTFQLTNNQTVFAIVPNFNPNTNYQIKASFYDAMVDQELLDAQIGMNISDPKILKTVKEPSILDAYVTATEVVVGVGAPVLNLELDGEADYVVVELQKAGETEWVRYYTGQILPTISIGGVLVGIYNIRIRGSITLPDGVTTDRSGYQYLNDFEITYASFKPPEKPSNINFKVAKILDGIEKYDIRVYWEWDKLAGANVKEFVVWYIDKEEYDVTGWVNANKLNAGSAKATTITNFPYNRNHLFRISAVAWGPEGDSINYSDVVSLVINESTVIDNTFTNETGIELNYAHIKGSINDNGVWKQTFLVDAATGGINLGLLDGDGVAPISFDPTNKTINVKGEVITETIRSANFVLTNLYGNDSPALYSDGKTYGSNSSGLWLGYDNNDAKYKFDLGNADQYIRFNGSELNISGKVIIGTPSGDVALEDIQGTYQGNAYYLSKNKPNKPVDTNYPPIGWSKAPPNRTDPKDIIWFITGRVSPNTESLVYGETWSDVAMWSGLPGESGRQGPGFYTQPLTPLTAFNPEKALEFFEVNFNASPIKFDVLTQYLTTDVKTAYSRMWDGTDWVSAALMIHGDMIATGTIRADKLIADSAFLQKVGVNVIYNTDAALSANPEAVYKMKIDLQNGYIHIR